MIKVALHINGNETDHSINVWGQVETDLEKNLIKINYIWIKDLNIKILVGAWECFVFFCLRVR